MKKFLLPLFALAVSCFATSCASKTDSGISPAAQKNLDASHGVTQAFETKDFSKLGDYIAADAVDHAGDNGDIKGLDSMKVAFTKEVDGIDNMKSEVIKELADDEYVMSWTHFTGKYSKAGMGHKAGDNIDMKGLEVSRFKDGKGVEHWFFMEPADMMKMEASMQQAMPMKTPADSSKKK
jgi:hypothetical protein